MPPSSKGARWRQHKTLQLLWSLCLVYCAQYNKRDISWRNVLYLLLFTRASQVERLKVGRSQKQKMKPKTPTKIETAFSLELASVRLLPSLGASLGTGHMVKVATDCLDAKSNDSFRVLILPDLTGTSDPGDYVFLLGILSSVGFWQCTVS